MEQERKKKVLLLAAHAGRIMMKNGAEISRVEETITRICQACKIDNVEVFAMPSGIFVTLDNDVPGETPSTYVSRIKSKGTDLNKISMVNQFSREFTTTDLSIEEGMQRLDEIDGLKSFPFFVRIVAAALCSSSFAVIFGGSAMDFLCAFLIGMISYMASRLLQKYDINFFIRAFCCCALAAFCALVLASSIPAARYGYIISGTIMLFVPGVAITTSIRDFLSGDMISGLSRMVEAFLTAAALAAGAGLVLKLWVMIGGITL